MIFEPSRSKTTEIKIFGEIVKRTKSIKFLGIYIDENLEWTDQTDHLAKQISSGSYA